MYLQDFYQKLFHAMFLSFSSCLLSLESNRNNFFFINFFWGIKEKKEDKGKEKKNLLLFFFFLFLVFIPFLSVSFSSCLFFPTIYFLCPFSKYRYIYFSFIFKEKKEYGNYLFHFYLYVIFFLVHP